MEEFQTASNINLSSQYKQSFSKDEFSFGSGNFNFKIYVYNLTPFSSVSVSQTATSYGESLAQAVLQ